MTADRQAHRTGRAQCRLNGSGMIKSFKMVIKYHTKLGTLASIGPRGTVTSPRSSPMSETVRLGVSLAIEAGWMAEPRALTLA